MIDTSETLLGRLKAKDANEAWKEFYDSYWGAIIRYAKKIGLNDDQAGDVLQETMVTLMRILPDFIYDRNRGKFRNFLFTIVHRKALAHLRRSSAKREVSWNEIAEYSGGERGFISDGRDADALIAWREALMEEAIRRVRADERLAGKTIAIFDAYVVQGVPVETVERRFGVKANAIYQIRNRVVRRVRAEVAWLIRNSLTEE